MIIDYQNVYMRAREAFGASHQNRSWHVHGQVRPLAVGLILRGPKDNGRELVGVHVYRGLPSSKWDPKGYEAAQRQVASWVNSAPDLVVPHTRPLNYRDPEHPREKGVDVQLAIDFVVQAHQGMYDTGIIFSDDTDLHPALEAVGDVIGSGHVELASWHDLARSGPRVVVSGGKPVPTRFLGHTGYNHVKDTQDYNVKSARKPRPPRRP